MFSRYATLGLHHAMIHSRSDSNRASAEVSVAQDAASVASYEDLEVQIRYLPPSDFGPTASGIAKLHIVPEYHGIGGETRVSSVSGTEAGPWPEEKGKEGNRHHDAPRIACLAFRSCNVPRIARINCKNTEIEKSNHMFIILSAGKQGLLHRGGGKP